jgi:hypothetical protein
VGSNGGREGKEEWKGEKRARKVGWLGKPGESIGRVAKKAARRKGGKEG